MARRVFASSLLLTSIRIGRTGTSCPTVGGTGRILSADGFKPPLLAGRGAMQRSTRNLLAATSLVVGIWARPADAFQPPAALAAPAPTIVDVQVAGNKNVARERILSHVGFL